MKMEMLKIRLEKLPKEILYIIHMVANLADRQGIKAYVVGGLVRDLILGKENYDLDFVLETDAIDFSEKLSNILSAKIIKHQNFRTATLVLPNNFKVDFATARSEYYETPGILPKVKPSTIQDDLFRRDFSINAMAIQINKRDFAKLLDFFNGIDDLGERYIRVLHNLSFLDDPTRILRAVRFQQRLGFRIEPHTLLLIKQAKRLKILKKVSKHRLRDEIILMLKEEDPLRVIRCVSRIYGLDFIHPRMSLNKKTAATFKRIKSTLNWFLGQHPGKRMLDSWLMYFSCLVDGLSSQELARLLEEFGFSNGGVKRILSYRKFSPKLIKRLNKRLRPSQIFGLLEPLSYEVILLLVAQTKDAKVKKNIQNFLDKYNTTRLLVSGNELKGLGVSSGPQFKKILDKILDAKIDGRVKNRQDELDFVKRLVRTSDECSG